jgi:hypothetical protein
MSIKDIFNNRKEYDRENTNFSYPNLPSLYTKYYLDSWYVFPYYGKVDTFGIPVMPSLSKVKYCSYGNDENKVLVLQPVVDYFLKLREDYLDSVAVNSIKPTKYFKNDIPPIKGFINGHEEYVDKMNNLYVDFVNYLQNTTKSSLPSGLSPLQIKFSLIKNYDDFINELLIYIKNNNLYITRAGYVESLDYSLLHTGLALEIYKESSSNDQERKNFYNDINGDAYLELCIRNNFKIDREIPWRTYLDIRTKGKGIQDKVLSFSNTDPSVSPKIQDYIPEFKEDIQLFFDTYYIKAVPYDDISFVYFAEFMNIINNYYSFFNQSYPFYGDYKINECGKASVKRVSRGSLPVFEMDYYVQLYLKFRNAELNKVVDENVLQDIYNISYEIYKQKLTNGNTLKESIISAVKYYTDNIGTLAYRNPSLYELDEKEKMP